MTEQRHCFVGRLVAALCFAAAGAATSAHADMITGKVAREICAKADVGPETPYGETREEAANKRVVFDWNCMTMVERKPKEAFERYVSKDWCDHGHLINKLQKPCGSVQETLVMFNRLGGGKPLGDDDQLEFPLMSSVNGAMVTMYGAGVDIFEVRNGKIVAHYDASPPRAIALKAHDPTFPDWVKGGMKGPPPGNNP